MAVIEEEAGSRFGSAYRTFHRDYQDYCSAPASRLGGGKDVDGLGERVRRYCLKGIERVATRRMQDVLGTIFNPVELAKHLAQRDTSGVRHIRGNGSMKGDLWVLMLIEHLAEVVKCFRDDDVIDEALTEGFLEVFTEVRHAELGLPQVECSLGGTHSTNGQKGACRLTRKELSCLRQLFINKAWIEAQATRDAADRERKVKAAGKEILDQVFRNQVPRPSDRDGHALDARWLEELGRAWGMAYMLGVGALLDEKESLP